MSSTTKSQTQDWLKHLTDDELALWKAKPKSKKDWYLEHTEPENRQRLLQTELRNLENQQKELLMRIIQRLLHIEGLQNRICCSLRSDERFIEVLGRDRIKVSFYWQKGYWKYLQDGSMHQISGDVDDLIRFMKSMDWIPDKQPKKGQLSLWDQE